MFWSPAVTRLSVAFCCPTAGVPSTTASSTANKIPIGFMTGSLPIVILRVVLRVKMQGRQRQGNADRVAQGEPPCIVNEILLLCAAPYPITIKAARVGALHDLAPQYEAAIGDCIGIA